MQQYMNLARLVGCVLVALAIGGCSTSPSTRAYELEKEGNFLEAARLHESEAERYRTERVLYPVDQELRDASRNYENAGEPAKAREMAQARVDLWNKNGAGKIMSFSDRAVDTLADTADALASLAEICSKLKDGACVASAGERIIGLFDSRAVNTVYLRTNYRVGSNTYAQSLERLAGAHIKVGQHDLALRAKIVQLSTGHGLDTYRYQEVISLAKTAGKNAVATELEKRHAVLSKVPFEPGTEAQTFSYRGMSDNPRGDAQKYAAWAQRLERAGGPALAAIARLEGMGADRHADHMEGQLRDRLKAQEEREANRKANEESTKQYYELLQTIQSMQPKR